MKYGELDILLWCDILIIAPIILLVAIYLTYSLVEFITFIRLYKEIL